MLYLNINSHTGLVAVVLESTVLVQEADCKQVNAEPMSIQIVKSAGREYTGDVMGRTSERGTREGWVTRSQTCKDLKEKDGRQRERQAYMSGMSCLRSALNVLNECVSSS